MAEFLTVQEPIAPEPEPGLTLEERVYRLEQQVSQLELNTTEIG